MGGVPRAGHDRQCIREAALRAFLLSIFDNAALIWRTLTARRPCGISRAREDAQEGWLMSENERVVRRYVEDVLNNGDMTVFDELVDPEYIDRSGSLERLNYSASADQPSQVQDRESVRTSIQELRRAVPSLRYTITSIEAADDMVRLEWTAGGVHEGPLMGREATKRSAEVSGTSWARVRDGKLIEGGSEWDPQEVMSQVGLL